MDNQHKEDDLTPQESLKLITKMLDKVQDDALWKVAKKRASFKLGAVAYIVINGMLIGLWYVSTGPHSYFWPGWCLMGWGLGVVFQFVDAYMTNGVFSEEREFEKLKKKQKQQ
jgi:hypothetical protein